jgi:hypothetical protein
MSDKIIPITAHPVRHPATNLAPPGLQAEFIDSARAAMGQPNEQEVLTYVGQLVTLVFNDDRPAVTGMLTRVFAHHPSFSLDVTYLVIDSDEDHMIPLNSVQSIQVAFVCPRCGAVSYNRHDVAEGYCGRCHAWTAGELNP